MPSCLDLVSAARSMLTGWEYRLGAHGGLDTATGLRQSDCQYLVDRCCQAVGIAAGLGPTLPYEVPFMVEYTTFTPVPAAVYPWPGLIVVFADPAQAGTWGYYAHTGIVSGAGRYISAYNTDLGVLESAIADTPLEVAFYLDAGLARDDGTNGVESMDLHGNVTLLAADGTPATDLGSINKATRLLTGTGAMVVPTTTTYPVYGLTLYGVPGHYEPAWLTLVGGQPVFILTRNASATLV